MTATTNTTGWRAVAAASLLMAATTIAGYAPARADSAPPIEVCSLANRTARVFTTSASYSLLRAALVDPAKFGPGGLVDRSISLRPGVATIDAVTLAGCEVFFLSELTTTPASAELAALANAVHGGMRLIADVDTSSATAPTNAVLGSVGGPGRTAVADVVCTNSSTGGVIGNVNNGVTNGAFGDIRGGTFATTSGRSLLPSAGDDVAVTCSEAVVRFVIPPAALAPGSGLVMVGGDPSAINVLLDPASSFYNPNNEVMYLNAIAGTVSADLVVTHSCPAAALLPGEEVSCSVVVSNAGPADANDVSVSVSSPAPISASVSFPLIPAGESETISYTMRVDDDAAAGSALAPSASATSSTPDSDSSNNTDVGTIAAVVACDAALDFSDAPSGQSIRGTAGDDVICGSAFDDTIRGSEGNDIIFGHGGSDFVQGQDGGDRLFGGAGDDRLQGASDHDMANGGSGEDRCWVETAVACEFTR